MKRPLPFAFLGACWILLAALTGAAAAAEEVEVETMTLEGRLRYPDGSPFNATTRVTVNHGEYATYSRPRDDGRFTVPDVPPGIYLLEAHSPTHHFSQVKCQFKAAAQAKAEGKPVLSCLEYVYPGARKAAQAPERMMVLTALATYDYFETKRGFSLASILKNPMILISESNSFDERTKLPTMQAVAHAVRVNSQR